MPPNKGFGDPMVNMAMDMAIKILDNGLGPLARIRAETLASRKEIESALRHGAMFRLTGATEAGLRLPVPEATLC